MSSHLRKNLEQIEQQLLSLATRVEEAVRCSVTALLERRVELAQDVISRDHSIDKAEVELEEECLKALALHQPVATDLRFVAACLKINNDLERIGDLAANIGKRAISLAAWPDFLVPSLISDMVDDGSRMLRESIDAFIQGDARLARRVCEQDDRVDQSNRRVIAQLLESMHEDPERIDPALELISAAKSLERIADHATNIAEDVVYLVEGDIIRHNLDEG